ncbi:MAG: hypothetical protein KatS3mg102_0920 [Planctomycetota bacterium]|nr:MAG: hypothetical protein KatS3mg102_0920 [Planctomycetota bacterium]
MEALAQPEPVGEAGAGIPLDAGEIHVGVAALLAPLALQLRCQRGRRGELLRQLLGLDAARPDARRQAARQIERDPHGAA